LSLEVLGQITSFPKTLFLVSAALTGLLFLPGIPVLPGLSLVAIFLATGYFVVRQKRGPADGAAKKADAEKEQDEDPEGYGALKVEPIEVNVGVALVPMVTGEASLFMDRIAAFRKQHALESGLVLPRVRFRDSSKQGANAYEITLFGVAVARGEIQKDRLLAIHAGGEARKLKGIETRDPTYGLPAVWIEESERETARTARFTLVDAPTVFLTHLSEVLKQNAATLLTRAETERILARVRVTHPGMVEELIPTVLSLADVQKVLQNLLRNVESILETLADSGRASKDPGHLTELVRQKLGAAICQPLTAEASALHVLTLDPAIEQSLAQSIRAVDERSTLVVEPKFAEQVITRLAQQCERMMKNNLMPVLLCSPDLRRHVRTLSERVMPHLRVISVAEIPSTVDLKAFGTVTL
jgi:flagellar biosynthesis protein FlhA